MNIFFHTAMSVSIAVMLYDTDQDGKKKFLICFIAFIVGVIVHGILDYVPHGYPIPTIIDILISVLLIGVLFWRISTDFRLLLLSSFAGNIFPDLIDLLPKLMDKYLHTTIGHNNNIFPWHWSQYSGSLYGGHYQVSYLNHILVIIIFFIIVFLNRNKLKLLFIK